MSEELLKTIETGDELLKIYGDDFQRDMLFVIEIYAAWCGPSQAALSTYRKIKDANEQKKFKLCKVCADVYDQLDEKGQGFFDLGKWKVITGADPEADADNPECVLPLPVGNELVCMNYARAKLGE